jgi:CHAD domain-containing protein
VLGLAAFRLWRSVRAARRELERAGEALSEEGRRLTEALEALPERQGELRDAVVSLQRRVAVLTVLARGASDASAVLRAPLRYLGR